MTAGPGSVSTVGSFARRAAGKLIADLRNEARWIATQDIFVILIAIALPWSTTAVAVLVPTFAVVSVPMLDLERFRRAVRSPASLAALALFFAAALGMLWSFDASSAEQFRSAGQLVKLLLIPLLLYHFSRSRRGLWVIAAFIASCSVVLGWSWLDWIWPTSIDVLSGGQDAGVPVKNYIAQSQEFGFCVFALAGIAYWQLQLGRRALAVALVFLALLFVADMLFVVSARTALIYLPVLLLCFALVHLNRRAALLLLLVAVAASALAWTASPYLRDRVLNIGAEVQQYREKNAVTSAGQRLEYWRKSLKFVTEAPLLGHGTGSTRYLFERDAVGQSGVSAEVIANPHNQTLNVAVQWGLLGCLALFAMWFAHARLFIGRSLFHWIGLAAVVQNICSSLLNSHISDFTEGWLYVLAVGVAGGVVLGQGDRHGEGGLRLPVT
jgi:O-antigen ligase